MDRESRIGKAEQQRHIAAYWRNVFRQTDVQTRKAKRSKTVHLDSAILALKKHLCDLSGPVLALKRDWPTHKQTDDGTTICQGDRNTADNQTHRQTDRHTPSSKLTKCFEQTKKQARKETENQTER